MRRVLNPLLRKVGVAGSLLNGTNGRSIFYPLDADASRLYGGYAALKAGIAGYWKLGEATGQPRADSSPNGNTLVNNAGVSQVAGLGGQFASAFAAASTQYLSLASNPTLQMGAGVRFTITAWVNLTSVGADRPIVSKWNSAGTTREFLLEYANSSTNFRFFVSSDGTTSSSVQATTLGAPTLSTWYFVAAWYDGVKLYISINNQATPDSAVFSADCAALAASFSIGSLTSAGPTIVPFNGNIQAVGLWKRVLTAPELTQLYNGGSPLLLYG